MKKPFQTDVAVLLLFFNRPEPFAQVFAAVRQARPSRLFLYQDGPRTGRNDMPGIEACRAIVADEQIDWQCEVHRQYLERNQGCDPSEYLAQKWAFSMADKCIVLEDDDVPALSFFPFCKEMLDRYEHDERIGMIAGLNTDEVTPDCDADYFLTSVCSIWGWASWRRVVDTWQGDYAFLDDARAMDDLQRLCHERGVWRQFLPMCRDHKASGKPYYESIFWASMLMGNRLAVMPRCNMINNIGLTGDTTHFSDSLATLPRGFRRIFTMRRFELQQPLHHPRYIMEHLAYKERYYRCMGWNHPLIKVGRSLEQLALSLRHGEWRHIVRSLRRRLRIWAGLERHA